MRGVHFFLDTFPALLNFIHSDLRTNYSVKILSLEICKDVFFFNCLSLLVIPQLMIGLWIFYYLFAYLLW